MAQAQQIIDRIIAEQQKTPRCTLTAPYEDEPILRTGADLLRNRSSERPAGRSRTERGSRPPAAAIRPAASAPRAAVQPAPARRAAHDSLPPRLRELRALEGGSSSRDRLFVEQARLAADYEDDATFAGSFSHHLPTYRAMTDEQLRGYFGWRTRARRGDVRQAPIAFAFVHAFELLNGIGDDDPHDAYSRLLHLWDAVRAQSAAADRLFPVWLHDHVVFRGLDASLLEFGIDAVSMPGAAADAREREQALNVLAREDAREGAPSAAPSDEELFDALAALSAYRIDRSRLLRAHAPLLRAAACAAWRELSSHCRIHCRHTLLEQLFGQRRETYYPMFRSAVFFGVSRHGDAVYDESPTRSFACRRGRWTEIRLRADGRSRNLGRVLKAVDSALRTRLGEKPLKEEPVPAVVARAVAAGVDAAFEAQRETRRQQARSKRMERARSITFDFGMLDGIRDAAAATCESLLIDEERQDEEPLRAEPQPDAAPDDRRTPPPKSLLSDEGPSPSVDESADASEPLSALEAAYVRSLLSLASPDERAELLARAGTLESLMVDTINEKLYDLIGDVIIEDTGDGPAIVGDYVEDAKGYAGL